MLIGEIGLNLSFNVLIQSGFQDYTKIMLVYGGRTLYCIVICEPFPLLLTTDALCIGSFTSAPTENIPTPGHALDLYPS